MNEHVSRFRKRVAVSIIFLFAFFLMFSAVSVTTVFAQERPNEADSFVTAEQAGVAKFGLIAAAVAFGFGAIGAGIAIAHVGSAAMGTIGEKPEVASQALIFIALAEGLVVFGFITALMILGKF